MTKRNKFMKKISLIKAAVFTGSLLLGTVSAQAACSTCRPTGPVDWEPDDLFTTYSAVVKQIIQYQNAQGQWTSYWNYTTLTGTTQAYCEQQLSAALTNPNVIVVQFCEAN
jgi:hypothetical protein